MKIISYYSQEELSSCH